MGGYGTDADGGSQILKYIIEWDASPTFSSGNAALRGTLDFFNVGIRPYSTVISGLTCTHSAGAGSESIETYFIRIFAYNAVGQGAQCGQEGALCDGSGCQQSLRAHKFYIEAQANEIGNESGNENEMKNKQTTI